jgi:hypothetical protein
MKVILAKSAAFFRVRRAVNLCEKAAATITIDKRWADFQNKSVTDELASKVVRKRRRV